MAKSSFNFGLASDMDFETVHLAHLLRSSVTDSCQTWLEHANRDTSTEVELERIQSAWLICLEFFIQKFDTQLREKVNQSAQSCQLMLSTCYQTSSCSQIPREFNLIELQPSLDPTKPIRCSRRTSPLDQEEQPVYDVLSYAQDTSHQIKRILIDGAPMTIQKTLESALRHLRLPDTRRLLWIDALCVTSPDTSSWGHSVQEMPNIYARARQVLVWLGNESNTSEMAFEFLQALADLPSDHPQAMLLAILQDTKHRNTLDAIFNLMSRPWWDRVGLLQKLLHGCEVIIWCGTHSVSWNVFSIFFHALQQLSAHKLGGNTQYTAFCLLHMIPTGSLGFYPSLQRYTPREERPRLIEALSFSLETIFTRSSLTTAWVLAFNRIGMYLGSFLTHLALVICRDDVANRQARISEIFKPHQTDPRLNVGDVMSNKTEQRRYSDDRTGLIDMIQQMVSDTTLSTTLATGAGLVQLESESKTLYHKNQTDRKSALDCWIAILNIYGCHSIIEQEAMPEYNITESRKNKELQSPSKLPTLWSLLSGENIDSEIICKKCSVDLLALSALGVENGPYIALSHLWAGKMHDTIIQLDGAQTQVSSDLSAILLTLRRTDLPVLLWFYAIGKSPDYQERVPIIGTMDMYSWAGHVFVCGDEHDTSYFDPVANDGGITEQLLQLFGSPKRHFEAKKPLGVPIILPRDNPLEDYARDARSYPYQALPNTTSIRLLRVAPLHKGEILEDKYRLIQCSMSTIDLESRPEYDALSYTWGDPLCMRSSSRNMASQTQWYKQTFEIECDGISVFVGANLYTALICLRWTLSVREPSTSKGIMQLVPQLGYIWVDQLCINQKDTKERNSQVSLMGRIYRQANVVVVWLGGEDEYVQDACTIMATLSEKFLQDPHIFDRVRSSGMTLFDTDTYRVLGIPRISIRQWIALYAFLSRSWFGRAWAIQEVCLARKPMVLCGLILMPWDVFVLTVETLRRSEWASQLNRLGQQSVPDECENTPAITTASLFPLYRGQSTSEINLPRLRSISDVRASLGTSTGKFAGIEPLSLVTNITLFRTAQATDPKDKIYAFMSISREFHSNFLAGDGQIKLAPNYQLSTREVFIESAKMMLLSSPALELLSLVQNTEIETTVEDLPSWVPDFSIRDTRLPLEFGFPSPFTAADGLGLAHRVFLSTDILEVRGVYIRTITSVVTFESGVVLSKLADIVSHIPTLSAIPRPKMNERLRHFVLESEICLNEDDREMTFRSLEYNGVVEHQTRFEVLWRTMLTDSARGHHPLPGHFGTAVCTWFEKLVKELEVKVGYIVLNQGVDADEHIDKLAREYTALRQLLSQKLEEKPLGLPPDFKRFLDAARSSSSFSLGAAKQEYDRMVKLDRSITQVDESVMQDVGDKVSGLHLQSLFRTCSGEIGLGSKLVNSGDEVWVLAGGNVPFVLRRVMDGRYRLLEECYVHGVMHGEAVENARESCKTIQI
ncbi:heterokaryon incompatibility protein-domain-containing protein, partial [Nemania sp. FL0031]